MILCYIKDASLVDTNLNEGGDKMKAFFSDFLKLFIPFFLANVASRYVTTFVDNRLLKGQQKTKNDITFANRIYKIFDSRKITTLLDNVCNKFLTVDQADKIDEIIDLYEHDRFYNKRMQHVFDNYVKALIELDAFHAREFSSDPKRAILKMHRYMDAPNGNELYSKNLNEANQISEEIYQNFKKMEKQMRRYYPSIF